MIASPGSSRVRTEAVEGAVEGAAGGPMEPWKVQCLNCAAPLSGPFCSACGQRAVAPHPSVKELAGDAVSEMVGWDGKFLETLRALLTRPGELTRQWTEGRRAHFISPIRLYLTASLVFFLMSSLAPDEGQRKMQFSRNGVAVSEPASRPEIADAAVEKSIKKREMTPAERDSALKAIEAAPWIMRPMARKVIEDEDAFMKDLTAMVPKMLFALLPLYACVLMLFYWRRTFPEHLYFAVHLHAFVFVALTVGELSNFARNSTVSATVGIAAMLWIAGYSLIALRRMYGGSWGRTIAKGFGIMLLYLVIAAPVMALTLFLAAF